MLAALQHVGVTADLLTFDGFDHQLDDSEAHAQMLTKIELLDRRSVINGPETWTIELSFRTCTMSLPGKGDFQ